MEGATDAVGTVGGWTADYEKTLRPHLPDATDTLLRADDRLPDLGLDSLEIVQLLLDLETLYAVTVPDELLSADTFATVGSLWTVISALVRAQGADE